MLTNTYTPEANAALAKIQSQYAEKISAQEKHLAQLRGELSQYEALGESFSAIAERCNKVQQEIKHTEWMLESIKADEAGGK